MLNDYLDPIHALGMPNQADNAFALEFLTTVKTGVRFYAIAITETSDKQLRETLKKHLRDGIQLQTEIYQLMMEKGWFYPYDMAKQFELDLRSAELAVKIAELDLFPMDTDRKGVFATPEEEFN